ncbi:MAG: ferredoxin family protein [Candidatus Lokiarchaeota archaeon]|nr:ferredoxin family protein [Candidatus Lokiarchaeota archaeon]
MQTKIKNNKTTKVYKMSFKIEVDMDACSGCGTCYEVCPSECFGEPEGGKVNIIEENRDDCVGCRACETQCEEEAITITEE